MADKVGSIYVDIGANLKDFESKMKTATSKLNDFGKKANQIGRNISTKVTLPIIAAGAGAINMASDYEESLNKVDVAFGKSSGIIQKFAEDSLRSFGIAEGSALDMAALFGDMATSMGISQEQAAEMSTSLVGLAGDLSSFKNIRLDVAETAMKSIFTGETESLKNLGIVMTQANLQAFAYSQGIQKNLQDMTEAEKVNLRYAYVLEKTTNAQGDFERTSGGAANQMRIFTESMKELGQTFGEVILPAFTRVIKRVNDFVQRLGEMDDSTKRMILTLGGIAAVIGPALLVIGQMSMGLGVLSNAYITLAKNAKVATVAVKGFQLATKGGLILALAAAAVYMIELANGTRKSAAELRALKRDSDLAAKGLSNMNEQLERNKEIAEDSRNTMDKWNKIASLSEKQINRFNHKALKQIREELVKMKNSPFADAFGGVDHINSVLAMVEGRISKISEQFGVTQVTDELATSMSELQKRTQAFGLSSEDVAKEKLSFLENAINDLIERGLTATSTYQQLVQTYRHLKTEMATMEAPEPPTDMGQWNFDQQAKLPDWQTLNPDDLVPVTEEALAPMDAVFDKLDGMREKMDVVKQTAIQVGQAVSQAFAAMGEELFANLTNSENAFERFAANLGKTILKLISMLLSSSIAFAIEGGSKSGAATGPAAVFTTPAFIATAVSGVLSAFASIPKFAEGGAVTGPTLAMIGEKPGSRGEAIIPFEKIPKLFNEMGSLGQNMMVEVRGVLDGDVIRLVQNRAVTDNALVR